MNAVKVLLLSLLITGTIAGLYALTKKPVRTPQITDSAITSETGPSTLPAESVPLPTGEDTIRTFFALIAEGNSSQAVLMMDEAAILNEAQKQQWQEFFGSFKTITVASVEESGKDQWTDTSHMYRVVLRNVNKQDFQQTLWDDGENIRWIPLVKRGATWKIAGIASGP